MYKIKIQKSKYKIYFKIFLPLLFFLSIRLSSAEEEIAHTIRCYDGVVLILGTKEGIKETKDFILKLKDKNLKIEDLAKKIRGKKFNGIKEVEEFYEESFLQSQRIEIFNLTVSEAEEKNLIPYISDLNLLEAKRLLKSFGLYVLFKEKEIGNTGVYPPVDLVVQSAGVYCGNFARIFVDGIDVSKNERGYNIAVVNQSKGVVEKVESFDTWVSEDNTNRMVDFIKKIENGRIVLVAVKDEGTKKLNSHALSALRSIGGTLDMRGYKHFSHAIIGVKGAKTGDALEDRANIAIELGVYKGMKDLRDDLLIEIVKEKGALVLLRGTSLLDEIKIVGRIK